MKSRRRREDGDDPIKNRKAFRLCVREEDRAQLLNASLWPDSVSISERFFKIPTTSDGGRAAVAQHHKDTHKKPPQATDSAKHDAGTTATSDPVVADVSVNDNTILAAYDAGNSVVDCSVIVDDGDS